MLLVSTADVEARKWNKHLFAIFTKIPHKNVRFHKWNVYSSMRVGMKNGVLYFRSNPSFAGRLRVYLPPSLVRVNRFVESNDLDWRLPLRGEGNSCYSCRYICDRYLYLLYVFHQSLTRFLHEGFITNFIIEANDRWKNWTPIDDRHFFFFLCIGCIRFAQFGKGTSWWHRTYP